MELIVTKTNNNSDRRLRNNILILESIVTELSGSDFDRLVFIKPDKDASHHTYVISDCRHCNSTTVQLLQRCLDGHECGRCTNGEMKPITREQFDERVRLSFDFTYPFVYQQHNIRIVET